VPVRDERGGFVSNDDLYVPCLYLLLQGQFFRQAMVNGEPFNACGFFVIWTYRRHEQHENAGVLEIGVTCRSRSATAALDGSVSFGREP
jgi:hypothetical protein